MLNNHSQYMQLAIDEAWRYQLLTYPNPAVGATVVQNNQVLSTEAHHEAGKPHAEVLALKSAYLKNYPNSLLNEIEDSTEIHEYLILNHKSYFHNCEIFVTLEPCNHVGKTPACANLLSKIGIKKVYIGTLDPNAEASGGKKYLENIGIDVEVGILEQETDKLLYPFLKYQSGHFSFFKIAMREDGTITGGYITTQDSLDLVHEIRTKLDLIVIGGNTVRTDRPKLDSRYSKSKKSSDILIYSKEIQFDSSIPLFSIKNREVTISNNLNSIKDKKFIMIEGGYNFLDLTLNQIDYLMVFISHKQRKKNSFPINQALFSIEHSYYLNQYDEVIFLKRIND